MEKTETTSSGVTTIDVVRPLDDGEATELARCEGVINAESETEAGGE